MIKIISGCGSRQCQNQIEKENKRREENGIVSAIRNGKDKFKKLEKTILLIILSVEE